MNSTGPQIWRNEVSKRGNKDEDEAADNARQGQFEDDVVENAMGRCFQHFGGLNEIRIDTVHRKVDRETP